MNRPVTWWLLHLSSVLLSLTALPSSADDSLWSKLWYTPDQRGERLLQSGHPKEAAQTFSDPHRQAYAHLQAGEYQEAAETLKPLKDAEALYNKGNAFAHNGQLQEALEAYNAALAKNPKHHDAQHNRDVVQKALTSSPPSSSSSKDSSSKNASSSPQNTPSKDSSSNASNKAENSASSDSSKSAKENQTAPSNTSPSNKASSPSSSAQASPAKTPPSSSQNNSASSTISSNRTSPPSSQTPSRAPLKDRPKEEQTSENNGTPPPAPLSEKQLSREQWLKSIPDDPGGLLRRKFLIQYKLKQQESRP
jgi:Ca-activated chloride channel homolog